MTIESFRHKRLRRLFEAGDAGGLPADRVKKIRNILFTLSEALDVSDMDLFPGWKLHPLKGDKAGFWSVSVSGNWRIIFRFEDGKAFDVDLVDYH